MGEISCQWKKQIPRFADSARDDNLGSVVMAWHYFGSGQKEIEGAGDEGLEVLAVDDGVEETVFEEEFGALKSFGSFWRMVCSMTRGPAKPMSAPGSPMLRSPSMAKLAVTPPVVGSVSTEM